MCHCEAAHLRFYYLTVSHTASKKRKILFGYKTKVFYTCSISIKDGRSAQVCEELFLGILKITGCPARKNTVE